MSSSVLEIPVHKLDGTASTLGEHKGKALLIVNVASKCGLTKQYEGLEKLWESYRDRGLVVVGFPANDFAGQEPGTNEEIQEFCSLTYGVDFPMYSKITVIGESKHPLYAALVEAQPTRITDEASTLQSRLESKGLLNEGPASEVLWNFEKFLVNPDGEVVARFAPDTTPDDPVIVEAIEAVLP